MSNDKMREAFEADYSQNWLGGGDLFKRSKLKRGPGGSYVDPETAAAWWGYQQSPQPESEPDGQTLGIELHAPTDPEYFNRRRAAQVLDGCLFTCVGKGGRYEYLGTSTGAGTSRGQSFEVYRDTESDCIYHRTYEDFSQRMESIAPSIAGPKRYRHDCCFADWIDGAKQSTCGNCNRIAEGLEVDENGDFL